MTGEERNTLFRDVYNEEKQKLRTLTTPQLIDYRDSLEKARIALKAQLAACGDTMVEKGH